MYVLICFVSLLDTVDSHKEPFLYDPIMIFTFDRAQGIKIDQDHKCEHLMDNNRLQSEKSAS